MWRAPMLFAVFVAATAAATDVSADAAGRMKQNTVARVLCLHGGGGSAQALQGAIYPLMETFEPQGVEFVFVNAASMGGVYGNGGAAVCVGTTGNCPSEDGIWLADPPSADGPKQKSDDPKQNTNICDGTCQEPPCSNNDNWADSAIALLDGVVASHGPFDAILGYSQGTAMSTVYFANNTARFDTIMLFNGYVPTSHLGLTNRICNAAPLTGVETLVFMATNDQIINNGMTTELAAQFPPSAVTTVTSTTAGHGLPDQENDPTYSDVEAFISARVAVWSATSVETATPTPTTTPARPTPTPTTPTVMESCGNDVTISTSLLAAAGMSMAALDFASICV